MADERPGPTGDDRVVVAVDQGTSSTKALVVDVTGAVVWSTSVAIGQSHPAVGHVEQDADEILASVVRCLEAAAAVYGDRVACIGLSTQRESAVVWDRSTGRPLAPLLGWQDRRTTALCSALAEAGHAERVRRVTGLPLDPMFSALKFRWLLDAVDPDRARSRRGEVAVGTVDSWLVASLTGEHRVELGNASRTQLLDLDSAAWSPELLDLFDVPVETLPEVSPSTRVSAPVTGVAGLGPDVRVTGVLGDSHAALFAHGVRAPGQVKVTYGTGSSIMGLSGGAAVLGAGLVRTVAWADPEPVEAFEGNILSTGATVAWLGRLLGRTPDELAVLAQAAPADHGVDLVPAFAGLGAPWWDESAVAVLSGFDLGTDAGVLSRAAFESIVLQVDDVLSAVGEHGDHVGTVLADGGPSRNDWLMQLQADLGGRVVVRSDTAELSARGAAQLAGRTAGLWSDADTTALRGDRTRFDVQGDEDAARARRARWLAALARSRSRSSSDSAAAATAPRPSLSPVVAS